MTLLRRNRYGMRYSAIRYYQKEAHDLMMLRGWGNAVQAYKMALRSRIANEASNRSIASYAICLAELVGPDKIKDYLQ